MSTSEFVQHLREVFSAFGPIAARRMFGGHGVYHDGLMFALVADGTLYLKTDAENRPLFLEAGLQPFVYVRQNKPTALSYYRAPEEIFDDPEVAASWARRAYGAALRAAAAKEKPAGKRRGSR